jgi:hypothetical protein
MKRPEVVEQYVTDTDGHRLGVLIDIRTYQRLREAEEELEDIRAYDEARPKAISELSAGRSCTLAEYRARRTSRRS